MAELPDDPCVKCGHDRQQHKMVCDDVMCGCMWFRGEAIEWGRIGAWEGRHQESATYTGWWFERRADHLDGMEESFHVGSRQDCDDLIALLERVRERLPEK